MVLNEQLCDVRKDGFCVTHQVQTKKVYVTTKKWKERSKGRGFGFVTSRTAKFQCSGRVSPQNIGNDSSTSRNLDNLPGEKPDYLTGISGNRSQEGLVILEHSDRSCYAGD